MSRKNDLRKYGKNASPENDKLIPKGEFSMETAKSYIIAFMLAFHIFPLVLILCGPFGRAFLNTFCLVPLNPMMVLAIMLIYGIKIGFNMKMPLIGTLLSAVSVLMYHDLSTTAPEGVLYFTLIAFVSMFIVHGIMAYAGALIGAFVRHFKIF